MSELLRIYAPEELGDDGYPYAWHRSIKKLIRDQDDNRCLRCGHPYAKGDGEWSPCDEHCTHSNDPDRHGIATARVTLLPLASDAQPDDLVPVLTEARWRILTVHHLDGDKANCRWWNLVSLCQRCHLTIQGKVRMDRPWPWPHTDWFKPYAAAFYAFKYAAHDLSRAEVMADLDMLLNLGAERESMERMPV